MSETAMPRMGKAMNAATRGGASQKPSAVIDSGNGLQLNIIVVEQFDDPYRGSQSVAYKLRDDEVEAPAGSRIWLGDTDLDAAMLCYIVSVFGEEVKFKLLWENGEPRYQPYE